MNDIFFADLVREISHSNGTGDFVLGGAEPGYRSFADAVPNERIFYYGIANNDVPEEWEIGKGHIDANGQLIRTPITSSQNDNRTNFSDGKKIVNLTISADWFDEQSNMPIAHHEHEIGDVTGLSDILDNKQSLGDYAAASHGHEIGDIDGLNDKLSAKQDAGDYANAAHAHDLSDLGINNLTAQPYLRTSDIFTVSVDSKGQNFANISGNIFPARRTDGGNIISPTSIEIPNGQIQLSYAVSSPANGPAVTWGSSYSRMVGLYINSGINYQGDQYNGPFNIRNQTNDGSLGDVSVSLRPKDASQFRYGLTSMLDNNSNIGAANKRFSNIFLANNPIVTSDERQKENIAEITDQMLNWYGAIIQWKNFTMKDGDGKIQIGVLAQDIERGAKAAGMDDSQIKSMGLLHYQQWDAEYLENPIFDDDGNAILDNGKPILERILIQEAGDSYGVKYDQLFALSAAWSLRETKRQQQEIDTIKDQLAALLRQS